MGNFYGRGLFMGVMFDGSVRAFNSGMPPRDFHGLITQAGGEAVELGD